MIRLGHLSNKFQKRTLRPLYGQTQAYPYAARLDSSFRDTDGSIALTGTTVSGSATFTQLPSRGTAGFLHKGGLIPGQVVTRVPGSEKVALAAGNDALSGEQPFGLLANFVGGQLDECGDEDEVGVWRGPSSVFELLAPAFGTVSVSGTKSGANTPLYVGADGRLTTTAPSSTTNVVVVANLLEVVGSSRIVVELRI